ncbi:MAG: polysaccharide deacetylase family protein [Lachnospiraceae bacterium]|nr:polysaccharide deacetylase family protein [Lachnospiraceae bacterium]
MIMAGMDLCLLACCLLLSGARLVKTEISKTTAGSTMTSEGAERRRIALTFDDGPHPVYTEELLDGLKERGVKATFFVTGEHARQYPDLIRRMQEEGHLIGNHTYSHVQLRRDHQEEFIRELQMTNEVITSITGEEVLYVRPPYGSWDRCLEKGLNMFPVLWTIDPTDWSCLNADTVTCRVEKKAKDNAIILLHDSYQSSVDAALRIVDELSKEGYEFVTVDEVLTE